MEKINFIYPADKTDFSDNQNRLNPHAAELIFTAPFPANKMELFVQSATHNAPYIHPSHDSILL